MRRFAVPAAFALLNGLLLAALVWAMDDTLTIRIHVSPPSFTADVLDASVIGLVDSPPPADAGLALYLEGEAHTAPRNLSERVLDAALRPLMLLDADAAWRDVRLEDRDGFHVWSHDFTKDGLEGWRDGAGLWSRAPTGAATTGWQAFLATDSHGWSEGTLTATLERGHGAAGIVVRGQGGDGVLLLVRPLHRDVMWWRIENGRWDGPIAGAAFTRPWQSATKDLVRLILRPYFLALGLAALFAAIGLLARRLWPGSDDEGVLPAWFARPIAATLALGAFLATAAVATFLLERMPHVQDSVAYLFQAKVFALGRISVPLPPHPEFFEHEFVVMRDGQWFGKYPPGFPALLALGVLVGRPWLVNPAAAGLTVVATYGIGARVFGRGTGLIAALLLTISPFFLFLGGSFMAHTAGLLFVALFALGYVEADRGRLWAAPLAGLALGVGATIRPWTALLIAAPFGIDLALRLIRAPRRTLVVGGLIALGALPPILGWMAFNDVLAGSPLANTQELWWTSDQLGFGPDKGLFGHTPAGGLNNTLRNVSELVHDAFGWPAVATFALAAVPFAAFRAGRWERVFLASWLALMAGYFFWWADGIMYGPRFYHEAMAFMCLLTARGLATLSRLGRAPGYVLAALVALVPISFNLTTYLPTQVPLHYGYNYVSHNSLDTVALAGVHNAVVFTDEGGKYEWWHYGKVFSANSPLLDTDVIYARDLGPAQNAKLMALYPDRRYYRLRITALDEIVDTAAPGVR